MKPASADGQNESAEAPWPCVPKIASSEFEQSVAVTQLAVKLCELQKRELQNKWEVEDKMFARDVQTAVTEPEKKRVNEERNRQMESRIATLDPEGFLPRAWQLIENARKHVLRAQTDAEYLVAHGGSHEAAEIVVGRTLQNSRVRFKKVCDSKRHKGDTEPIHGVQWRVYTTDRGFEDLFFAWWHECGDRWKDADLAKIELDDKSYDERVVMAKLVSDPVVWKERGEAVLDSWKRDGLPPNDFLALARFRAARDKRAANLTKKPKRKGRAL